MGMVDGMSVTHTLQPSDPGEKPHRQAAVHETVVHDDVGQPERRHSSADPDRKGRQNSMHVAADHHERGSKRGVRGGECVVGLEAPPSARVVRTMDAPQRTVPDASVETARPRLHRRSDDQRDARADRDMGHMGHEEAS